MSMEWNEAAAPIWTQQETRHYLRAQVDQGLPLSLCDRVWFRAEGKKQGIKLCAEILQDVFSGSELIGLTSQSSAHDPSIDEAQRQRLRLLSKRESEILSEVARGMTNRKIARRLCISPETVKQHLKNIFQKLNVTNRTQAARLYGAETK